MFETLIFIFLGIGFFSFQHPYKELTFSLVIITIILILLARYLNIVICSYLSNLSRSVNRIDKKKQFFLWFSGIRGAMAFALALKSKLDYPRVGSIFLVLTLIIISFTLFYSSIFTNYVLDICEIKYIDAENLKIESSRNNIFVSLKNKMEKFNNRYLMKLVERNSRTQITNRNNIEMREEIKDNNVDLRDSLNRDESSVNQRKIVKELLDNEC